MAAAETTVRGGAAGAARQAVGEADWVAVQAAGENAGDKEDAATEISDAAEMKKTLRLATAVDAGGGEGGRR